MAAECVVTPPLGLKNASVTLTATFYGDDGTAADPGATTVAVSDLAGAVVVAAGTATVVGDPDTTKRSYVLAAHAQLDILTVTWTTANYGAFTSTLEIVGGFLYSLNEVRAYDNNALSNANTYPPAALEDTRARLTDEFQTICGVSFVPRVAQLVLDGGYTSYLDLRMARVARIRAVETRTVGTATWTAYTTDQLAGVLLDSNGFIQQESSGYWPSGRQNVRVTYEHGYERVPGPIRDAALMVTRYLFAGDILSQRTITMSSEFGTTQLATVNPERGWHYGLPAADGILERYREGSVAIG